MGCVTMDTNAMRSIADQVVAGSRPADILSICQALGGINVCTSFCQALEQDKCWNRYITQLATGTAGFQGGTLTAWMVLQAARDQCSTRSNGCANWAAIEPLARPYQYEALCACAWPAELPARFLATHPGARFVLHWCHCLHSRQEPANRPPTPSSQATRRTSWSSAHAASMAPSAS